MNHAIFKGLVFDMDGTLTVPTIDFEAIRREIDVPEGDIAQAILAMPQPRQAAAWAVIEIHETRAIEEQALKPGARELLVTAHEAGLRIGIVTRNTRRSVEALRRKFDLPLHAIVSREFPHIKPHPGPVLHLLKEWAIHPSTALTIGDYIHDIESGRDAGTKTCFFRNPKKLDFSANADYSVSSMAELQTIIFPAHPPQGTTREQTPATPKKQKYLRPSVPAL